MSKVEKSDLTAGGDAPPVEAIKTDCIDNTAAIIEVKSTDIIQEDASADEVAKEVNAQTENERSIEATNDIPVGEVANSEAPAEINNIITEIINASANDVVQAEAQEFTEESNTSASALQSGETLQSKSVNEEKV